MTKATLCSSGVPRLLYMTNQSVLGSQRGSPHSSSRSRVTACWGRQAPSGSRATQVLEALTFHILGAVGSPAAQWEATCLHTVDEEASALTHQHGNLGSPGGKPAGLGSRAPGLSLKNANRPWTHRWTPLPLWSTGCDVGDSVTPGLFSGSNEKARWNPGDAAKHHGNARQPSF